jgi:beta-N-acetylhexosaminidase
MAVPWQPGTHGETQVLQKFLLGFQGTTLPDELAALLRQGLAGVAIFHRNFRNLERLRSLTDQIRGAARRGVLVGVDQEGGTRFSLPEPFTQWPSPAQLGLLDDAQLVEQMARAMAREIRAAGCNLNFAPMLDLAMNPTSPVTQHRSFGADPHKVAQLGAAFIRGLAAEKVLACAKHFPGHGDTQVDPHEDLPVFHGTAERLDRVELVPFAQAISAGVPVIMTAHILLPQIDPARPASLSRAVLLRTLRQRLGFDGVILADDLGMGAIAHRFGPGEAAVETFLAGSDLALLCHDWAAVRPAIEVVRKALENQRFNPDEWQASRQRILDLCTRTETRADKSDSLEVIGSAGHRALAAEIRARAERARE